MAPRPEFRLDVFQGMGWMWLVFANVDVMREWFGWMSACVESASTVAIFVEYGVAFWFLFGAHLVDVWLWKRRQRKAGDANG